MDKAQQEEYSYAKHDELLPDGTSPANLTILDAKGNKILLVTEASAKEGWYIRLKCGKDGLPLHDGKNFIEERIKEKIKIIRKTFSL